MLDLTREKASALADGGDLYDALLDDYEPGATEAELEAMFGALRPASGGVAREGAGLGASGAAMDREFDEAGQLALSQPNWRRPLAMTCAHGRIDKAVHPFSSGSGLGCADHHADRAARSIQLFLFDDPRSRSRGIRAGDRPRRIF